MKSSLLLLTVAVAALMLLMVDYGSACGCQDDCCCNYRSRQCCGDGDSSSSSSESKESSEDDNGSGEKMKCPEGFERCASHACYRVVKLGQAETIEDLLTEEKSPCLAPFERLALPDKKQEMHCMKDLMKKENPNSHVITSYTYDDPDIVDDQGTPVAAVFVSKVPPTDPNSECVVVSGKHLLSRVPCSDTVEEVICEYVPPE